MLSHWDVLLGKWRARTAAQELWLEGLLLWKGMRGGRKIEAPVLYHGYICPVNVLCSIGLTFIIFYTMWTFEDDFQGNFHSYLFHMSLENGQSFLEIMGMKWVIMHCGMLRGLWEVLTWLSLHVHLIFFYDFFVCGTVTDVFLSI